MRAVFRQGWLLVRISNREFNSELSSLPLFLFQWFWLIKTKKQPHEVVGFEWNCFSPLFWSLVHDETGIHREVFVWAECGIYTVKIRCQNKWSDWEAAVCASCNSDSVYELRMFCVQRGVCWDPDIDTNLVFIVAQADWYSCYIFIDSSSEEWLFFSALTHVGLENKFWGMLWSRRKVLHYPCQYWEMHNLFFWGSWSDWGILFCFIFICRVENVVQQFDWLMQLMFDMHPNVLFYFALVLLSINLSSLR